MENAPDIFDKMPEFSRIGSFSFLLWAILIGLFLAVIVNMGPAFITLVQTSLHRGARSAAWFAIGVILNDAMVISLCILTSVQVVMRSQFEASLACIGAGIILLLFGIFTYRRKVKGREEMIEKRSQEIMKNASDKPAWFVFLGKGFVLNILNPFVWIFWFSAVAMVAGNMGGNKLSTIVFFAIVLGTTLAVELLKAWGASRLKKFLNPDRTALMNKIAGVLLMLCGVYFIIFRGIVNLF
ncbi:MAG: lysine exporter protein LysE/YggA [bacterium F082]|nr:MAG: lysine exporter protein LysE/YggA [bacterium F082]KWW29626.1 MAG: lysine exporter protein LysE/YggA [bacterium P201]